MKVVLLAGGFGTRISEESHLRPKPMIEIGDRPILWHIMKMYSAYGFYDFIICCGYRQYVIKEYFADYYLHNCDVTFDFVKGNHTIIHNIEAEPWKVTLVDTGLHTMTGGRIKRVQKYIGNEAFMLTYGDGISDIDIEQVLKFHKENGKIGTISAVRPEGRFGILELDENEVKSFREKDRKDTGWINCGFMVMEPDIFKYIEGDYTIFEKEPLERLAAEGQLGCYKHTGFWQCMDTMRDKKKLENLWNSGQAVWKVW